MSMNFRSKNILITGGLGFIGSNFIKFLDKKYLGINIFNLDSLTYAGNLENIDNKNFRNKYELIKGDICDKDLVRSIFNDYNIDGVINFAAESHVDNSIKNPEIFIKSNIIGVQNLIFNAYKLWMKSPHINNPNLAHARFHQISTDEVYGSILKGSFKEENKYAPNSPYSASKASADMIVRSFNKTYGLNTTITISSNNFGPNQHNEKLIPKLIYCLLNEKQIPVYGDGLNVRDWIFVEDHCAAVDIVYNNSLPGKIYNIAGKNEYSNLELIDIIYKKIKNYKKINKNIVFVEDRFGHDRRYSININKINRELNWRPELDFEKKLNGYIKNQINKNEGL